MATKRPYTKGKMPLKVPWKFGTGQPSHGRGPGYPLQPAPGKPGPAWVGGQKPKPPGKPVKQPFWSGHLPAPTPKPPAAKPKPKPPLRPPHLVGRPPLQRPKKRGGR